MPPQEAAVGIDLGTTFSVIAHLDSTGRPCTIPNSEGDLITPSAVFFDGANAIVGKEAIKAAVIAPEDVAQFMKRDMGCAVFGKPIHGEHLPPEVIQSFILDKLRRDATLKLGEFRKVVITVPAFFNEPRRKATQDAGSLAGLEVIDIINEPTAAAIAFGVQQGFLTAKGESKQTEKIVIYDLGGGTFDVTLMEIDGRHYNAIATAGDVYLGGIDWDRRIADYVAEQFSKKNRGCDPRQNPAGMQRLLREAEDAKRTLSARDQTTITFEHAGDAVRVPLSRQQFEEMTADLLDRTRFTLTNLLQEAKLKWDDITRLLLVGGSTRMPMVQRMVEQVSGKKPDRSLSADESVAHGAAIYAGLILASEAGSRPEFRVRNVNSHNLGVLGIEKATNRPRNQVMIPRNTSLPATRTSRFVTYRLNQTSVAVNVVEGGDASGNDATAIGKCVVRDLPPGLPAGTPVEVTFQYGQNGRLMVKARLPGLNKEAATEIERASGMTVDMLRDWNQRLRETSGLRPSAAIQQKSPPPRSSFDEPSPSLPEPEEPPSPPHIAQQRQGEPPELPVVPPSSTGTAWFYAKDGVRHGPVTDVNMKELAARGQLAPTDLVWKEGMSQWAEARSLKGLFSAPASTQPPPPLPSAPNIPPIPATGATTSGSSSLGSAVATPALWNPHAAGFWSLLFGWAFGSFLLARNWKALGDQARAKRCMFWFYAVFPWIPVFALVYHLTTLDLDKDSPSRTLILGLARLAAVLVPYFVWALMAVNPQVKFVKDHFGGQYTRKRWLAPLALAAGLVYGLPILGGALIGFVIGMISNAH